MNIKVLFGFALLNSITILLLIAAHVFAGIINFRDEFRLIGVTYLGVPLLLATLLMIRKLHLKIESSATNKIIHISMALAPLVWASIVSTFIYTVQDNLSFMDDWQTTADNRLEYRLSGYNLRQTNQRVRLYIRDSESGESGNLLLELPFALDRGGSGPNNYRVIIEPVEHKPHKYIITTTWRLHALAMAVFLLNMDDQSIVLKYYRRRSSINED